MQRAFGSSVSKFCWIGVSAVAICSHPECGLAQAPAKKPSAAFSEATRQAEAIAKTPETVEVKPVAKDDEIAARLARILSATDWFRDPEVTVREGVVFLKGHVASEPFRTWAGDVAHNTRDVVAVVNQIEVDPPPIWDSSDVRLQLTALSRTVLRGLPIFVFAIVVLAIAWMVSQLLSRVLRQLLSRSIRTELLRRVAAQGVALFVFLVAVYLVLQVAGLTRLALTLAGGTGLLGLALGIAFKEITENFLASIYLSLQKPFETGDLIEVNGMLGYVQRVTARTTILMTLEGNHVQIPNATVFKNVLQNFTSNPNRRMDFLIGIGYEAEITNAQAIALQVLREHPAVLKDPDPWVLVDGLGPSTVNLRVYFWLNGKEHSWLKVRSAVIRQTKGAFQKAGISLPDESREIVFPHGVPVRLLNRQTRETLEPAQTEGNRAPDIVRPQPAASAAEGGLASEAAEIKEQASNARSPEGGENLLASSHETGNGQPVADKAGKKA